MDIILVPFFFGAVYAWTLFVSFLFQAPLRDVPPWLAYGHLTISIFMTFFLGYYIFITARILVRATLEMRDRARA